MNGSGYHEIRPGGARKVRQHYHDHFRPTYEHVPVWSCYPEIVSFLRPACDRDPAPHELSTPTRSRRRR